MLFHVIVGAAVFAVLSLAGAGISVARGAMASKSWPGVLQAAPQRALPSSSAAINLVNKYVTMSRGRAVRVENEDLTIVYSRENGTKGRVKFKMDTAFDDVFEGDVGVLVIVERDDAGATPFYKFIRDAGIPTLDDVLELGTGDDLTDDIYKALRGSREV